MVEFALQRLRGTDDGWNSFLAGTIAGLSVWCVVRRVVAWRERECCSYMTCTGLSIAIDTKERQKAVSLYVFFKSVPPSLPFFMTPPIMAHSTVMTRTERAVWCGARSARSWLGCPARIED